MKKLERTISIKAELNIVRHQLAGALPVLKETFDDVAGEGKVSAIQSAVHTEGILKLTKALDAVDAMLERIEE